MEPRERRERERLEMRSKIIETARDLMVNEGYEAVTMRRVAKGISYTATTLYNHFKDKEELVRSIMDSDFQTLRRSFDTVAAVTDPIERLRALTDVYITFAISHTSAYKFMFLMQHPPRDPAESAIEHGNPDEDAYAFLLTTVTAGIADGRFREDFTDPDFLAQMIWAGVHGIVTIHLIKATDPWLELRPLRETAHAIAESILRGVLRKPADC